MKITWAKPVHKVGDKFDKQEEFVVVYKIGDLEVEKEWDRGVADITIDWRYFVVIIKKDGSDCYQTTLFEKDLDRLEKM